MKKNEMRNEMSRTASKRTTNIVRMLAIDRAGWPKLGPEMPRVGCRGTRAPARMIRTVIYCPIKKLVDQETARILFHFLLFAEDILSRPSF